MDKLIKLRFSTEYKLHSVDDLDQYDIKEKIKQDSKKTLKEQFDNGVTEVTMRLYGSEYNYLWLKENLKTIDLDIRKAKMILDKDKKSGKLTEDDYTKKLNSILEGKKFAKSEIMKTLSEYEDYYKQYKTYGIILFEITVEE